MGVSNVRRYWVEASQIQRPTVAETEKEKSYELMAKEWLFRMPDGSIRWYQAQNGDVIIPTPTVSLKMPARYYSMRRAEERQRVDHVAQAQLLEKLRYKYVGTLRLGLAWCRAHHKWFYWAAVATLGSYLSGRSLLSLW